METIERTGYTLAALQEAVHGDRKQGREGMIGKVVMVSHVDRGLVIGACKGFQMPFMGMLHIQETLDDGERNSYIPPQNIENITNEIVTIE